MQRIVLSNRYGAENLQLSKVRPSKCCCSSDPSEPERREAMKNLAVVVAGFVLVFSSMLAPNVTEAQAQQPTPGSDDITLKKLELLSDLQGLGARAKQLDKP